MYVDNLWLFVIVDVLLLYQVYVFDNVMCFGCDDYLFVLLSDVNVNMCWYLLQIVVGWFWLFDVLFGMCLLLVFLLYCLYVVSLDKGCYFGQEIVVWLYYCGGNK